MTVISLEKRGPMTKSLTNIVTKFLLISNFYLDLVMDIALVFVLLAVKGSYFQFDMFTTQLLLLLVMSIAFPHFKSALTTAYQTPLVVLGYNKWKKYTNGKPPSRLQFFLIRIGVIIFYPLIPALLMLNTKEVEMQRTQMVQYHFLFVV